MSLVKLSAVRAAVDSNVASTAEKSALISAVEGAVVSVPDTWIYRIVVIALGLAIFVPLVALPNRDLLQLLLPIATTALGVLAGLLAPSPNQSS